jgi:outer membrane protein
VGAVLGATYSLGADEVRKTATSSPTWVRVLYGQAVEDRCDIIDIMVVRCTSIDQAAPTEIFGFSLGKTLLENLNGWPLDFVGYVNVILHHDRPFQKNGLELDVFLKAFYRGFPWSDRVLTRLGFGWGLSWSDPVPQAENSEQASRNRRTSRLLNYIEPSIDISLGDVFSKPDWKQTFLGLSITHRSGMFGNSQMLGRVDGGSNYLTVYAEHPF